MVTRGRILGVARLWAGTRFAHQGRVKRSRQHAGGVDCLGLLVGVAQELELKGRDGQPLATLDERRYSHQPDVVKLKHTLDNALLPAQGLMPADVLLMEIDGRAQHLGLVSDWQEGLGLIHAYAPARRVVEHGLDEWWRARIVAAYALPGLE